MRSFGLLVFLASLVGGGVAQAYSFYPSDWYCNSDPMHWARPSSGVRYVGFNNRCIEPNGWTAGPSEGDMLVAGGWAHWMWYREGLNSVALEFNTTACWGYSARTDDWLRDDSGNYYALDRMNDYYPACLSTAIGCTDIDATCFPGASETFDAARLVLRMDTYAGSPGWSGWAGSSVNTMNRCLDNTVTHTYGEFAWAHEVGHAYGLNEFDGWLSMMNSQNVAQHNCNVGAGFHPQPFSDETQAIRAMYPGAPMATALNVSGSPKTGYANSATSVATGTWPACGAFVSYAPFLFMNHYNTIPGGTTQYRAVLIPANIDVPTTSNIVATSNVFTVNSQAGAIYGLYTTYSFGGTTTIPPQGARLWIQLDPSNVIAETDEGDNLIPTGLIYQRMTGAGC